MGGGLPEEEFALFAPVKNGERGEGYLKKNSPSSPLAKLGGREGYLRRNSPSSPLAKLGGREGYLRRNSPSSPLAKVEGMGRVT
jgi:hypothetical protein